jgi:hypothetical protein
LLHSKRCLRIFNIKQSRKIVDIQVQTWLTQRNSPEESFINKSLKKKKKRKTLKKRRKKKKKRNLLIKGKELTINILL